jgi:hypothetical protein
MDYIIEEINPDLKVVDKNWDLDYYQTYQNLVNYVKERWELEYDWVVWVYNDNDIVSKDDEYYCFQNYIDEKFRELYENRKIKFYFEW